MATETMVVAVFLAHAIRRVHRDCLHRPCCRPNCTTQANRGRQNKGTPSNRVCFPSRPVASVPAQVLLPLCSANETVLLSSPARRLCSSLCAPGVEQSQVAQGTLHCGEIKRSL